MGFISILEDLNKCYIGYGDYHTIGMNFLCNYSLFPEDVHSRVRKKGTLLYEVLHKINSLYQDAVRGDDQNVLKLFESGILRNKLMRQVHRRIFLDRAQKLPFILRGDTPDLDKFVEFHAGFRGLGHMYAFRNAFEKRYGTDRLFNLKRLTRLNDAIFTFFKDNAREIVFYGHSERTEEEKLFINSVFRNVNVSQRLHRGEVLWKDPLRQTKRGNRKKQNRMVLQVCPRQLYIKTLNRNRSYKNRLFQGLHYKHPDNMLKQYASGKIDIEPPPNLLYEQKISIALLYESEYQDYFTEEERSIFPETYIVKKNTRLSFDGKEYTLSDIVDLPARKRTFVLKYAGLNLDINWGGRAVYRLTMDSRRRTAKMIQMALDSYEKHAEPWIIQKDISSRENIDYFNTRTHMVERNNYYRLYRPYFMLLPGEDKVTVIDIVTLFRESFKVAKYNNSIFGLVAVH